MPDPRVAEYAELLVDTCVSVKDGWQVVVIGPPLARPLLEEVARLVGERGAYAIMRVNLSGAMGVPDLHWVLAAPDARLRELAPIDRHMFETTDAIISVYAPENTRDTSAVPPHRLSLIQQASRPVMTRIVSGEVPWVGCQFPCPSLAQEAEMSVAEFEDSSTAPSCSTGTSSAAGCSGSPTGSTPRTRCGSSAPTPICS